MAYRFAEDWEKHLMRIPKKELERIFGISGKGIRKKTQIAQIKEALILKAEMEKSRIQQAGIQHVDIETIEPRIREFNNDTLYQAYTKCRSLWLGKSRNLIDYDLIFSGVDLQYVLLDEDTEFILNLMLQEINSRGYNNLDDFGAKSAGEYFGRFKTLEELNANRDLQ